MQTGTYPLVPAPLEAPVTGFIAVTGHSVPTRVENPFLVY